MFVCKNPHEKKIQRALTQYRDPKNYELVKEALFLAHREDLIGFDKKCLIPPRKIKGFDKRADRRRDAETSAVGKDRRDTWKGKRKR